MRSRSALSLSLTYALALIASCSSSVDPEVEATVDETVPADTTSAGKRRVRGLVKESSTSSDIGAGTDTYVPSFKSEKLVPMAFGPDGFPKVKKYFTDKTLNRVEFDFNGDGRVDMLQWMDSTGSWVEREAIDLAGLGFMSVTNHYEKSLAQKEPVLVLQEFDPRGNGRVSVWRRYKKGQLVLREIDRKGRGRPDYWEHFEGGKLVRIDQDKNADGNPDSQPKFKQIVVPEQPPPGAQAR
jgi:hypothetical protein